MAWRLARSLVVLRGEVQTVAPGTTFWTLGDEDHAGTWSDHNPNECCSVVCAADVLGNAGLDLDWFAGRLVATDPPALKYVIWRDRIWFPGIGWDRYFGQYHSHVHVSVGWGPDGRSTGPYDDTSPWGLLSTKEGSDMIYARTKADATVWASDGVTRRPVSRMASIIGGEAAIHMVADQAALDDLCGPPAGTAPAPAPVPVDLVQVLTALEELPGRVAAELAERMKA